MTKALMTLREFVRRLEPLSRETPVTLKRQVRFWTEVEAIPVANVVSTGSGKMRLYEWDGLLYAAVAIEMASWGVTIGFIKSVLRMMAGYIRGKNPVIEQALNDSWDIRLIVMMRDKIGDAHIDIMPAMEAAKKIEAHRLGFPRCSVFVIDLTELWAELR